MKVTLTYFKPSGKYYSSGSYESKYVDFYDILREVKGLLYLRQLPGLTTGHALFNVYIDIPHSPPHIICSADLEEFHEKGEQK